MDRLLEVVNKGKTLISGKGINASLDGFFKRPFGRDTYFTLLGVIAAIEDYGEYFADEDALVNDALYFLQYMSDEGELPHEVGTREQGYPFEVDENGFGRHFTSIDATGLAIVVLDKLMDIFPKNKKLKEALKQMKKMTEWSVKMVKENDGMVGYTHSGTGSREHVWQDGNYAIMSDSGELVQHPAYTILEQGIYWDALSRMAERFKERSPKLSKEAEQTAKTLKRNFNKKFIFKDGHFGLARAIDGNGNLIHSANIDSLMVFDFSYKGKTILNKENRKYLDKIVAWELKELSAPIGGLRTQGVSAPDKKKFRYHGKTSVWPFANCVAIRALTKMGYKRQARDVAEKVGKAILKFGFPIETMQLTGKGLTLYHEKRPTGETFINSMIQAWTVGWGFWLDLYLRKNTRIKL